ncbi:MAG: helix-turn-helix transcriptional regulator [Mycobacteriales bacterium]
MLLLRVLSRGPAHGYAVISALKEASGGVFDLPEGTVYPSLHRLEDAGLLSSDWDSSTGRRRRAYPLTARGEASLSAGASTWKRFSTGMNAVLGMGA